MTDRSSKNQKAGSLAPPPEDENTTLWAILLAITACIVGAAAFYVASLQFWGNAGQTILTEIGGLLFVSAAVALLWELGAKRRFMREILRKTGLAEKVWRLGFHDATTTFGKIGLGDYISGSSQVDIVVAGGKTVLDDNKNALKEIARRKGTRIRVILPNPNGDENKTMEVMARQFRKFSKARAEGGDWKIEPAFTAEQMRKRIADAVDEIDEVREAAKKGNGGTVQTWLLSMPLLYSLYRCDDKVIFVPYRYRPGKDGGTILTQVFEGRSSEVCNFFLEELEWMVDPDNELCELYESGGGNGAQDVQ